MNKHSKNTAIRIAVLIAFLIFIIAAGRLFSVNPDKTRGSLNSILLIYSSLIFIFLYIIGTFFIWYLKDPLKIVGAVVFGAYLSTLLIYMSEIVNAFVFFNISSILEEIS